MNNASSQTVVYINIEKGLQLKYPADWNKHDQFPPGAPPGMVAAFSSQPEGPMDIFRENVVIMIHDMPPGGTLDNYIEWASGKMREQVPDVQLIESRSTTLAGLPAKSDTTTGTMGPARLKWLNVYAVKNNRLVAITYSAEASKFDKFLGAAEGIINSLQVR